jgi:hypothetical protein
LTLSLAFRSSTKAASRSTKWASSSSKSATKVSSSALSEARTNRLAAEAREALQVLDDAIKERHEVRDIIDTVVYDGQAVSGEQIIKVLLGGIQKHLDEREVVRGDHGFV